MMSSPRPLVLVSTPLCFAHRLTSLGRTCWGAHFFLRLCRGVLSCASASEILPTICTRAAFDMKGEDHACVVARPPLVLWMFMVSELDGLSKHVCQLEGRQEYLLAFTACQLLEGEAVFAYRRGRVVRGGHHAFFLHIVAVVDADSNLLRG